MASGALAGLATEEVERGAASEGARLPAGDGEAADPHAPNPINPATAMDSTVAVDRRVRGSLRL
jgi:hypothetical protein